MFLAKGLFRRKREPIEAIKKNGSKSPTIHDLSAEELLEEELEAFCFIFDLEGALLDTRATRLQAWERVLAESKIQLPNKLSEACYGNNLEILQRLTNKEWPESNLQQLSERLEKAFIEEWHHSTNKAHSLIDGVPQFLQEAQQKCLPLALISDYNQATVEKLLAQFDLVDCFSVVISGETVDHGKPHPDALLKAALRLGKMPEECITFVSSNIALEAAYRAKMKTFAIRHADMSITPALSNIVQVLTDYQNLQPVQACNYTRLIDILNL